MTTEPDNPAPLLVVLEPLPNPILSPNARPHFRKLAKAKKRARLLAQLLTLDAINAGPPRGLPWPAALVSIRWFDRQDYGRDRDNALATLKAHIDGIADAGVVADDRLFTYAPLLVDVDRARPRVEITVEKLNP